MLLRWIYGTSHVDPLAVIVGVRSNRSRGSWAIKLHYICDIAVEVVQPQNILWPFDDVGIWETTVYCQAKEPRQDDDLPPKASLRIPVLAMIFRYYLMPTRKVQSFWRICGMFLCDKIDVISWSVNPSSSVNLSGGFP